MRFLSVLKIYLFLFTFLQLGSVNPDVISNNYHPIIKPLQFKEPRQEAYSVLLNKCNVCHIKRNKRKIFTLENMDDMSNAIYVQVFVKKRMPKGNKVKLTSEEYATLLTWISLIKN